MSLPGGRTWGEGARITAATPGPLSVGRYLLHTSKEDTRMVVIPSEAQGVAQWELVRGSQLLGRIRLGLW